MESEIKVYEIWSEGYRATGESGDAHFHGKGEGKSFKDACIKFFKEDTYFNAHYMTYWACHLFDNETDARKSFG